MKKRKLFYVIVILLFISGCNINGGNKVKNIDIKNPDKLDDMDAVLKQNIGIISRPNIMIDRNNKNYQAYIDQVDYANDNILINKDEAGYPMYERRYASELMYNRKIEHVGSYSGDEETELIQNNFLDFEKQIDEKYKELYPGLDGDFKIIKWSTYKSPSGIICDLVIEYQGEFVARDMLTLNLSSGLDVDMKLTINPYFASGVSEALVYEKYKPELEKISYKLKELGYGNYENTRSKNLYQKGLGFSIASYISEEGKNKVRKWLESDVVKTKDNFKKLADEIIRSEKNTLVEFRDFKAKNGGYQTKDDYYKYRKIVEDILPLEIKRIDYVIDSWYYYVVNSPVYNINYDPFIDDSENDGQVTR